MHGRTPAHLLSEEWHLLAWGKCLLRSMNSFSRLNILFNALNHVQNLTRCSPLRDTSFFISYFYIFAIVDSCKTFLVIVCFSSRKNQQRCIQIYKYF